MAEQIGVSRSYLSGVKRGKIKGIAALTKAARVLKVDPLWLTYGKGTPPEWALHGEASSRIRINDTDAIILLRSSPHTTNRKAHKENDRSRTFIEFPIHGEAVIITGNGGLPFASPGQVVMVDPTQSPMRDDIVVYWVNQEPVLYRFVDNKHGQVFLAALNAEVASIVIDAEKLQNPLLVVVATLLNSFKTITK